jgi:ribosomal protein S18 acetylase RimI-like enzyme
MKQLRRIEVAPPANVWQKASRALLRHVTASEAEFLELECARPGLTVLDGDAVLVGWPATGAIDLQYGFSGHDAFARRFRSMLERLLSAVEPEEAPLGVRFRLTDRAPRPYVEPVLWANAFEQSREWWRMTLDELPNAGGPPDEIADGFVLRPARAEDADAIAEMDTIAFPPPSLTPELVRTMVAQATLLRILDDTRASRAAGFLQLRHDTPGAGYVADLAVHPEYHRRGLGEALMRWALAWFRSQGLQRAALQVNTDNAPAIALYRKLGFEATDIGLDYRRPIDEDEVRQVLEKRQGHYIKVRAR